MKNENKINDSRSPREWKGKCEIANSQFCPFSEDGYWHGVNCELLDRGQCPEIEEVKNEENFN